jgi:hypothetical protein
VKIGDSTKTEAPTKDKSTCSFNDRGFHLMLQDYKGEAWELKLSNLNEEIDPEGSVMKLLSTKIIINLKKKEKKTWFQLLAKK